MKFYLRFALRTGDILRLSMDKSRQIPTTHSYTNEAINRIFAAMTHLQGLNPQMRHFLHHFFQLQMLREVYPDLFLSRLILFFKLFRRHAELLQE